TACRKRRGSSHGSWRPSACRSRPCWATTIWNRTSRRKWLPSWSTRAWRCSTAMPANCRALASPGSRASAAGSDSAPPRPRGGPIIKQFVHEAVKEALKLEAALARLRTSQLVALLHYSPVQQTCEGEPLEIYPFVGSSRLEEPLGRYPVSLVVHGHAHRGQL